MDILPDYPAQAGYRRRRIFQPTASRGLGVPREAHFPDF
jgi:hypothetical protein